MRAPSSNYPGLGTWPMELIGHGTFVQVKWRWRSHGVRRNPPARWSYVNPMGSCARPVEVRRSLDNGLCSSLVFTLQLVRHWVPLSLEILGGNDGGKPLDLAGRRESVPFLKYKNSPSLIRSKPFSFLIGNRGGYYISTASFIRSKTKET